MQKNEIYVIENADAKSVFENFKGDGKIGIIDFSNSLVVFPTPTIVIKKYKSTKVDNAFSQIKRWVSSEAFDQVFVIDGLNYLEKDLVFNWLFDHKSVKGFPSLIVSGSEIKPFWNEIGAQFLS
ncbi:MAG: hypothetical protein ACPKOI_12375 [Pleomorphochaeta sp.]|jgi:hypothetical protein